MRYKHKLRIHKLILMLWHNSSMHSHGDPLHGNVMITAMNSSNVNHLTTKGTMSLLNTPRNFAKRGWLAVFLLCWLSLPAWSAEQQNTVFTFTDPQQEARFQQLTQELRCLVCQNQSLADSHADLAGDLRREVYELLQQGKTDQEIIDFMVERYGDFVRFRPPINFKTFALWFGPAIIVALGGYFLIRNLRRGKQASVPELSEEERQRISALLASPSSAAPAAEADLKAKAAINADIKKDNHLT